MFKMNKFNLSAR